MCSQRLFAGVSRNKLHGALHVVTGEAFHFHSSHYLLQLFDYSYQEPMRKPHAITSPWLDLLSYHVVIKIWFHCMHCVVCNTPSRMSGS